MIKNNRTWLEINKKYLKQNYFKIKKYLPAKTNIIGVIKSNAYGMGANGLSTLLEKLGATYVAVSYVEEAIELRKHGYNGEILLLNQPLLEELKCLMDYNLIPNIHDYGLVKALNKLLEKHARTIKLHVEVDTGMGRSGLKPENVLDFTEKVMTLKHVTIEGIFTHLADADEIHPQKAILQMQKIANIMFLLKKKNIQIRYCHVSSSSGLFLKKVKNFNMVRIGSILYGIQSSLSKNYPIKILPILTWKAVITGIRYIEANEELGYSPYWCSLKRERIATISVGYADGFNSFPNKNRYVLYKGRRVKVLFINMNSSCICITNIKSPKIGDEVVLIGKQKNEEVTLEEIAQSSNILAEQVSTSISSKILRVYKD